MNKCLEAALEAALNRLETTGRYAGLIDKVGQFTPPDISYVFEALFADAFESEGIPLEYEVKVSPANNSRVDFRYQDEANELLCFELVSPEMSDRLKEEYERVQTGVEGPTGYGATLSSSNDDPFLRPEAQTIRLQEKLLEKVYKFPEPHEKTFSIIAVNCSSFHFGHLDDEDCRMAMYGKTRNPALQEHWEGDRVEGLLEETYSRRGAPSFRSKITAVIFVPTIFPHLLNGASVVLNPHRSGHHKAAFKAKIRNLPPVSGLRWI